MELLHLILIFLFILSLSLNYLSLSYKKTSMEIINEMGIGYNLGYIFDCYNEDVEIKYRIDQITLCGNSFPIKQMISSIKKTGFKTIRFPVTWINFIDDYGNINSDWMKNVKEVIDIIINSNMYCILNLENDGKYRNWLSRGIIFKEKFINLWSQIAKEFKDYDDHLIFESMDVFEDINYTYPFTDYDYSSLLNLTQSFVDTIRNSGGNNFDRLLIVSGAGAQIELSCRTYYKLPVDTNKKIAISLHYFEPYSFTKEEDGFWSWIDDDGNEHIIYSDKDWGDDLDYNELITNFDLLKSYFVDKGIPVIISEVGVLTEEGKKIESIREYLYAVFSLSADYNGITVCLWDTSNKTLGNMNYFNRKSKEWYDEKIKNNFKQISRGKYIKPTEYFLKTYSITTYVVRDEEMYVKIGAIKPLKAIFNIKYNVDPKNAKFILSTYTKSGGLYVFKLKNSQNKKEYDGTNTFIVDISKIDCYDNIYLTRQSQTNSIDFNYLTIEFEESFYNFNYKNYKEMMSNYY